MTSRMLPASRLVRSLLRHVGVDLRRRQLRQSVVRLVRARQLAKQNFWRQNVFDFFFARFNDDNVRYKTFNVNLDVVKKRHFECVVDVDV